MLHRPKLDKDGWPEWMWLLTEDDLENEPLGRWHHLHFGYENKRFTQLLTDEVIKQIEVSGVGDCGPADWAECWNRAVAAAGYDVPREWL